MQATCALLNVVLAGKRATHACATQPCAIGRRTMRTISFGACKNPNGTATSPQRIEMCRSVFGRQ
jgi:hypothetical protein